VPSLSSTAPGRYRRSVPQVRIALHTCGGNAAPNPVSIGPEGTFTASSPLGRGTHSIDCTGSPACSLGFFPRLRPVRKRGVDRRCMLEKVLEKCHMEGGLPCSGQAALTGTAEYEAWRSRGDTWRPVWAVWTSCCDPQYAVTVHALDGNTSNHGQLS
jgi:hypothetical protein